MWPKALSQLIELLPHLTRLVPAADRFFNQRSQTDTAAQHALEAMAEGMRGDLGQVTAAHAGIYAKLAEQSEALTLTAAAAVAAHAAAEAANARLTAIEHRQSQLRGFIMATFALVLIALGLLVFLALRTR
jgi:hypothetical protein